MRLVETKQTYYCSNKVVFKRIAELFNQTYLGPPDITGQVASVQNSDTVP